MQEIRLHFFQEIVALCAALSTSGGGLFISVWGQTGDVGSHLVHVKGGVGTFIASSVDEPASESVRSLVGIG